MAAMEPGKVELGKAIEDCGGEQEPPTLAWDCAIFLPCVSIHMSQTSC